MGLSMSLVELTRGRLKAATAGRAGGRARGPARGRGRAGAWAGGRVGGGGRSRLLPSRAGRGRWWGGGGRWEVGLGGPVT